MASGGAGLTAALLCASFAAGALTESGAVTPADDRRRLAGSTARADQALRLVVQDATPGPPSVSLRAPGGQTVRLLVADQADGEVPVDADDQELRRGVALRLSERDTPEAPDLVLGDGSNASGDAAPCARVVALAPSAGPAAPDDNDEAEALQVACAVAGGGQSRAEAVAGRRSLADDAVADRAEALLDALEAAVPPVPPRPVQTLEAAVGPGERTRAVVRVLLLRSGGAPATGEAVTAAYAGGSVRARTGGDGRAVLPLPDVGVDGSLPVEVRWEGVVPPGTTVGGRSLLTGAASLSPSVGWLRDPVPYALTVVVRRERA